MPSTLIFGTSWVPDQERRWVLDQWVAVTRKLNPDTDMLIVDSASPAMPLFPASAPDVAMAFRFDDNIGHLSRTGRDGWGRAFCMGLKIAAERHYDYVVHAECDLLCARPVGPIIARMAACGVGAAAPMAWPHQQMIETALLFMDMRWVRESDFIARYDWEHSPTGLPLPEQRVEAILADKFFALPLRGARNDLGQITAGNIKQAFPAGCDWLTHATPGVFRAMMAANGLSEA